MLAAEHYGINQIAIAGGVSANTALRRAMQQTQTDKGWETFIPPFSFTTDNAAMIAVSGYFKYLQKDFTTHSAAPYTRGGIG